MRGQVSSHVEQSDLFSGDVNAAKLIVQLKFLESSAGWIITMLNYRILSDLMMVSVRKTTISESANNQVVIQV